MNTILAWLGSINIMVGFFNLIPAFPLDGGRIIRALIWAVSRDMRRSTRLATWLGQGIGWMMILTGAAMILGGKMPFVGGGIYNGIWLILIGGFLNSAARVSYRQSLMEERLADVQVRSVMQTRVPIISSEALLGDLLSRRDAQPEGHSMFVMDGQDVVGMVAMKDVEKFLREKRTTATIREIMIPVSDLLYVTADDDVADAFERLQRFDMRHIPVMFNNKIVGLLHRKDVSRLLQLQSQPGM
jgi:predicted transcriptional regulator